MTDEQYRAYVASAQKRNAKRMETAKNGLGNDPHIQAGRALEGVRKPSKYRSRKTGGYASKAEARRAQQLRLMLGKTIFNLREQVSFELLPAQRDEAGKLIENGVRYVADFVYVENGKQVVEDVKGVRTPEYVIKRKLMLHVLKIRITEI